MSRGRKVFSWNVMCTWHQGEGTSVIRMLGLQIHYQFHSVLKFNSIHHYGFSVCWKCSWLLLPRCHSLNQEKRTTLYVYQFLDRVPVSSHSSWAPCASHKHLGSHLRPLCTLLFVHRERETSFYFFFLGTYFLAMITQLVYILAMCSLSLKSLWSNKC